MKEVPSKVMVLGIPFDVKLVAKIEKDPDLLGITVTHERRIQIKKVVDQDILESTLMHELIHAVLGITGHSERMSEDEEEALVIALESGLSQIYERK